MPASSIDVHVRKIFSGGKHCDGKLIFAWPVWQQEQQNLSIWVRLKIEERDLWPDWQLEEQRQVSQGLQWLEAWRVWVTRKHFESDAPLLPTDWAPFIYLTNHTENTIELWQDPVSYIGSNQTRWGDGHFWPSAKNAALFSTQWSFVWEMSLGIFDNGGFLTLRQRSQDLQQEVQVLQDQTTTRTRQRPHSQVIVWS